MIASKGKSFNCQAIVIKSKLFFEKDKYVELYSKEHGRFNAVLKAGATSKSQFCGLFSGFAILRLHLYKAKSLPIITEASMEKSFEAIRESFNHISMAYYFADIIRQSTLDYFPNESLFFILKEALERLNNGEDILAAKLKFYEAFLKSEGLSGSALCSTDSDFLQHFHAYSGRVLHPPLLLEG